MNYLLLYIMRIHFIAIGGAAMHNLAIALKSNGENISGSDDEIFEPSRTNLKHHNLLPPSFGWDATKISEDLDLIILGMHARKDNPELKRAQELGIPIMSYPEFIYSRSLSKKRVVIAGSHGKTSTTSMVLHVLKESRMAFDFMVGAKIKGFDTMVQLSDAPVIILEGDEYFSSPIDMKAKFLWYRPHIALITGIAWDHINVYPTKESYNDAFKEFIEGIDINGTLIYFEGDEQLSMLVRDHADQGKKIAYNEIDHFLDGEGTSIRVGNLNYHINVFGKHNLQNIQGARLICNELGITDLQFATAIQSFEGAANRLELLASKGEYKIFKDFAHSPSKLKATTSACKEQFPSKKLLAVMELHTFSSLTAGFLNEYKGSMNDADYAIVYFNPETVKHKKLDEIHPDQIRQAFEKNDLRVVTSNAELKEILSRLIPKFEITLLMTSGNFGGLDLMDFTRNIPESN